jgi:hypothetical protein
LLEKNIQRGHQKRTAKDIDVHNYNDQKLKEQKDKKLSTKHYTENQRLDNTNLT